MEKSRGLLSPVGTDSHFPMVAQDLIHIAERHAAMECAPFIGAISSSPEFPAFNALTEKTNNGTTLPGPRLRRAAEAG
jgi:hypothetical protein